MTERRRTRTIAQFATGALCAAVLAVAAPAAAATTIHVDEAATTGANNGGSWADAYTDLQSALGAASPGDLILVAQGTYRPHTTDRLVSFELVEGVTVAGGYATGGVAGPDPTAYPTVLSGDLANDDLAGNNGENSYHVVTARRTDSTGATLQGVTVSGGNANGTGTNDEGGGIFLQASTGVTIRDVIVTGNAAMVGAGINDRASSPTIVDTLVIGNTASDDGGGIFVFGGFGGSSPVIRGTRVLDNVAGDDGGGIKSENASTVLVNSVVAGNTSFVGGGIYNEMASVTVVNSLVAGNTGTLFAGGAHLGSSSSATFMNSVLFGNESVNGLGGAISVEDSSATVVNTVIADNRALAGGGIRTFGVTPGPVDVVNSIVWRNLPAGAGVVESSVPMTSVNHSDVEGWAGGGVGNVDVDPMFAGLFDYRLQSVSPVRELGDDSAVLPDTYDVDGDLVTAEPTPDPDGQGRIAAVVDMGAFERPVPMIRAGAAGADPEGDAGTSRFFVPVTLSHPSDVPVTVEWNTLDVAGNSGVAHPGIDVVAASGTVTFAPGATTEYVPIDVIGDTDAEPPLLWGEWALVQFHDATFAVVDNTVGLFGLGILVVIDDD